MTLIADKKAGKGGRFGRAAAQREVLKDLGEHPGEGGKIEVLARPARQAYHARP